MGQKVLVCGDHYLIPHVASHLSEMRKEVVILTKDDSLSAKGATFIRGDPTNLETLLSAGARDADAILVICKEDWDAAFIIMNARKLNPDAVIVANASQEKSTRKLYALGATRVVFPLSVSGHLIASSAVSPIFAEFMDRIILTQDLEIGHLEVDRKSDLVGKTLSELDIRKKTGCSVVGIIDSAKKFHPDPRPDSKIEEGQTLLCLGPSDSLRKLFESAKPAYREKLEEGEQA